MILVRQHVLSVGLPTFLRHTPLIIIVHVHYIYRSMIDVQMYVTLMLFFP